MNNVYSCIHRYSRVTIALLRRVGLQVMPAFMQRTSLAASLIVLPVAAYAQTVTGGASLQTVIHKVCTFILGPFGLSIAVLSIIAIGVMFMFRRTPPGIIAGVKHTGLAASLIALPAAAYAQTVTGGASPQTMINNVCTFILGPFGQSLAVLGIIAIGVLFMFGRASLGIIAGVIGGIVIMFGASYLGQTLTGG